MEPLSPTPLPPGRLYRFAWGLYLGFATAGVLWIGFQRGVIPLSLFLDPREWWLDLGLGLGAGLLLLGSWWVAERTFPLARDLGEKLASALGPVTASEAIGLAVLSGFAEELFFRGALQGAAGWTSATVLFALLHGGPGKAFRLWTLFALIAGALLGGLMAWRGNLLGPMVGHILVNAVNLRRLTSRGEDSARLPPGDGRREEKEI
ncbi:MAG: CPBP family intramembrane glutamic endopeptidase [Thermoanaerobaculia bacterium]